jgi:DNA replication initiation complex subunit (GINS family)
MPDQYGQLLEWRRSENASRGGLAKLPHNFYSTTASYLSELRRSYEAELRENPSDRKGELARQTYQRASSLSRDIVEGRMAKLVGTALHASVGGPREIPNTLPEERELLDRLVSTLASHRHAVAPYLMPTHPADPAEPTATPAPPEPVPRATGAPGSPPIRRAPGVSAPLVYVRIVKDGRPITVGSETIELRKEDVLSLPGDTAQLLIDAQIAERVSAGPAKIVT